MKTKYLFPILLVVILALGLSACGGGDNGSGNSTGATPSKVLGPSNNNIVPEFIFSNTGKDICQLYLSPVDAHSWGPDQLQGQTIPAGKTYTLRNIPAGSYDVRAVGCNNTGEQEFQVDIQNP